MSYKRIADVTDRDMVEVVVHGALFPRLVEWVQRQGFEMQPQPYADEPGEDSLPTFFIQPGAQLWAMAQRRAGFGPPPAEHES